MYSICSQCTVSEQYRLLLQQTGPLREQLLLNFTAAPNKSSLCLQPGAFSTDVSRTAGPLTRSLTLPAVCRAAEEEVSGLRVRRLQQLNYRQTVCVLTTRPVNQALQCLLLPWKRERVALLGRTIPAARRLCVGFCISSDSSAAASRG